MQNIFRTMYMYIAICLKNAVSNIQNNNHYPLIFKYD